MLIHDKRVADVVRRLTGVPAEQTRVSRNSVESRSPSFDSLDTMELIMELEEELDKEAVRWALRYIEAVSERAGSIRESKVRNASNSEFASPLWDRDLDE